MKVGDTPVRFFEDLQKAIAEAAPRGEANLEVERGGKRFHVTVPLQTGTADASDSSSDKPSIGVLPYATVALAGVQAFPGSPAADAGLQFRDTIVAIDGQSVSWWFEVDRHLREVQGKPIELEVERDGERLKFTVAPRDVVFTPENPAGNPVAPIHARDITDKLPGAPYGLFPAEIFVDRVVADRPAQRAGVEAGDMVLRIDDQIITRWTDIQTRVESAGTEPLNIVLLRKGRLVPVTVSPQVVTVRGPGGEPETTHQIGIVSAGLYKAAEATLRLGPLAALARGTRETIHICVESVQILAHILIGDVPLSESLGGPISIVTVASRSAAVSIFSYLRVMALISVSLGLINLFPIPLLDGGHIMFLFLEFVRGKPVSMRFREVSQQIGMIILFILMAFALANDVRINYFR